MQHFTFLTYFHPLPLHTSLPLAHLPLSLFHVRGRRECEEFGKCLKLCITIKDIPWKPNQSHAVPVFQQVESQGTRPESLWSNVSTRRRCSHLEKSQQRSPAVVCRGNINSTICFPCLMRRSPFQLNASAANVACHAQCHNVSVFKCHFLARALVHIFSQFAR